MLIEEGENMTIDELLNKVSLIVGNKEGYCVKEDVGKDGKSKNAALIDKNGVHYLSIKINKKKNPQYTLLSKKEILKEFDKSVIYSYHDNWRFKNSYESDDIDKLFELVRSMIAFQLGSMC